jgi:hypothetical protein
MEQFPSREQESELEKKVIEAIINKGQKDPEALRLFNELLSGKEAECGSEPKDQIEFDIWRAQLYEKAGDKEYALEILENILYILPNLGLDEIRPKIEEEIRKVES